MFFLSPIQFSHVTKVEKRVKQFEVTAFALKWLLDAIFNIKVIWENCSDLFILQCNFEEKIK